MASRKGNGSSGDGRVPRVQERKALQHYLNGDTKKDACLKAGYNSSTAIHKSTAIIRRVQGQLCEELEKQGLDAPALAGALIQGLQATQKQYFMGEKVDESPDYRARAQFSKMVIDVCGDAAPIKHDHDVGGHITIQQVRKEQQRLEVQLDTWLE